jgi:hypothetical protein
MKISEMVFVKSRLNVRFDIFSAFLMPKNKIANKLPHPRNDTNLTNDLLHRALCGLLNRGIHWSVVRNLPVSRSCVYAVGSQLDQSRINRFLESRSKTLQNNLQGSISINEAGARLVLLLGSGWRYELL